MYQLIKENRARLQRFSSSVILYNAIAALIGATIPSSSGKRGEESIRFRESIGPAEFLTDGNRLLALVSG